LFTDIAIIRSWSRGKLDLDAATFAKVSATPNRKIRFDKPLALRASVSPSVRVDHPANHSVGSYFATTSRPSQMLKHPMAFLSRMGQNKTQVANAAVLPSVYAEVSAENSPEIVTRGVLEPLT
jgi:hypothetical protein